MEQKIPTSLEIAVFEPEALSVRCIFFLEKEAFMPVDGLFND